MAIRRHRRDAGVCRTIVASVCRVAPTFSRSIFWSVVAVCWWNAWTICGRRSVRRMRRGRSRCWASWCNDPAVPAQVRPLRHTPRRVSSCPTRKAGLSPPYATLKVVFRRAGPGPADDEADDMPGATALKDFPTPMRGASRWRSAGIDATLGHAELSSRPCARRHLLFHGQSSGASSPFVGGTRGRPAGVVPRDACGEAVRGAGHRGAARPPALPLAFAGRGCRQRQSLGADQSRVLAPIAL